MATDACDGAAVASLREVRAAVHAFFLVHSLYLLNLLFLIGLRFMLVTVAVVVVYRDGFLLVPAMIRPLGSVGRSEGHKQRASGNIDARL